MSISKRLSHAGIAGWAENTPQRVVYRSDLFEKDADTYPTAARKLSKFPARFL